MATTVAAVKKAFRQEKFEDPGFIRTLFGSPLAALFWTPLRLYLGWQWLAAGLHKVNDPAWTRTGVALQGFWTSATKVDAGQKGAVIHYGWYHDFLKYMLDNQWYSWFARVIAFGETAIGIALMVGAFVGVAALFGAFMNFNFMLAGSASTNPVLFLIAVALVLAWKVAGFIGADYYVLPAFGTPWKPGRLAAVATDPAARQAAVGRRIAGIAAGLGAFAFAGVVAVAASNQWNATHPLIGYIVAAVAVLAAWVGAEAALGLGATSRERPTGRGTINVRPV